TQWRPPPGRELLGHPVGESTIDLALATFVNFVERLGTTVHPLVIFQVDRALLAIDHNGDLEGSCWDSSNIQAAQLEQLQLSLLQQIRQLMLGDVRRGEEMIAQQQDAYPCFTEGLLDWRETYHQY